MLTVNYVKDHIAALHGKTVRLRGEIDTCSGLTCSICSGETANAVCLGVALWPVNNNWPMTESVRREAAAGRLQEELYRFATVTVDAQIDATCVLFYDPSDVKREPIICTDRAYSVFVWRIVSVDQRRAATESLFATGGSPLRRATAEERAPVLAAWRASGEASAGDDPGEVEIFTWDSGSSGDKPMALCVCHIGDCTTKWPSLSSQLIRTPANPYLCGSVRRSASGFLIVL